MQRRTLWTALCTAVLALGAATTATAATTLDYSSPDESVTPFGNPDTQTYGQTVTVPANESYLRSFSFTVQLPTDLPFRAEVYQWDEASQLPTGPAVYESAVTHTSSGDFAPVSFDTGGTAVVPGRQYVLFLTTTKDPGPQESGAFGGHSNNPYSGGKFVYSLGHGFPQLFTDPWNEGDALDGYDASFTAKFAAPPVVRGHGTIGQATFDVTVNGPQSAPTGSASLMADGHQASGSVACLRVVGAHRAVVGLRDTTAGSSAKYYEFSVEDSPGGDRVGYLRRFNTAPPVGCRSKTPPAGSGVRISSGDIVVNPAGA